MPKAITRPRLAALGALAGVLVLTGVFDAFARSEHRTNVRAEVAASLDGLTRNFNDVIARETAAVDTMVALVEMTGFDPEELDRTFPLFADALMQDRAIRSVQLAPDGILEYVYPVEGNEAAVGLDLFADPERRRILLPAVASGQSVTQGPFELAQGGVGVIVRHPLYDADGSFWGFAAILLDWPAFAEATGLTTLPSSVVAGVALTGSSEVIAGDEAAFGGDPLTRMVQVGTTQTSWTVAMRPTGGWPATSDVTGPIWLAGGIVGVLAAMVVRGSAKRPELLERERRAALAELEKSEARFQATFQHAGVGIAIGDLSGRVVSANPAFQAIIGREDGSLEGEDVLAFIDEADRRAFERTMIRVYQRAEVATVDVRVAHPTGTRWGRLRVTTIPGEQRLFVGIVEDITDRLEAERALAASKDRFRRLVEHAPIAIQREDHSVAKAEVDRLVASGVTDLRGWLLEDDSRLREILSRVTILDQNPEARKLQTRIGSTPGPVPLDSHLSELTRDGFIHTLLALAADVPVMEYGSMAETVDGTLLHLDIKWQAPIVDGVPDYSNLLVTLRDGTALHETERRLQEEIESKDRFLASVAHELRTPLTAVVGFAHALQDTTGTYDDADRKEFQQLIAFHSSELADLIEDLLVWARADIGEVQVRPIPIHLGDCVAEAVDALPGVDIPVEASDDGPWALADPSRVRQIVRNLATNAARYGGPDPRISAFEEEGVAVLEVSDDGPALPPDRMEKIFAPYERSREATSMPGSIGLGLTVSRTLSRLQDGDLVFFRRGGRNVFRLTLPISVRHPGHALRAG